MLLSAFFGSNGLYFTASGQVGNARGEALKEDNGETQLKAENKLTLLAGGDALLKGVVASARRIEADLGGNLTLQSLQDSERYTYKSRNAADSLSTSARVLIYPCRPFNLRPNRCV